MALTFGVATTTSYGLMQGAEENDSAEVAEARGETGKVVELKAYSKGLTTRLRYLLTGSAPEVGATAAYGSRTGLVVNRTKEETNTGYTAGSIELRTADSATLNPLT